MADLAIVLSSPTTSVAVGSALAIAITAQNVSSGAVWFVGVVDGSEQGIRYPRYLPEIRLGSDVVAGPPPPEDPLVSPLRLVDFRQLAPGERFDPTRREAGAAYLPLSTFANFRPPRRGRYAFRLTVSTESGTPEQWLGRFAQDAERTAVLERIALVPRLTVTSNILEIDAS